MVLACGVSVLAHPKEIIDFLDQHWWSKASTTSAGPAETHEQAIQALLHLHRAYLDSLREMPPEELAREVHDALIEQDRSRPFNQFGTDADYEHYGRCAFLTVDEAVALSLGKHPRYVNWSTVKPYLGRSLFAQGYADRLDLLDRAIRWGELPQCFTPLQFLTWAHKYKVAVPTAFIHCTFDRGEPVKYWHDLCAEIEAELEATRKVVDAQREALARAELDWALSEQETFDDWLATQAEIEQLITEHEEQSAGLQQQLVDAQTRITALNAQISEQRTAVDEKPISTTERISLLTIVIAAAIDGHGYNPSAAKNSAPAEIASAATRIGLKMTDDTVRKYLNQATELPGFVPPEMVVRKPKSAKCKPKSV